MHTASPEVCQPCLVETKEVSFQCCRLTACSKCRHTPENQWENWIPASAMNTSTAAAQCIAPHTIPPENNPTALTPGSCVRYTHTLLDYTLGKLMTISQAFPRNTYVYPTSLWRQLHLQQSLPISYICCKPQTCLELFWVGKEDKWVRITIRHG